MAAAACRSELDQVAVGRGAAVQEGREQRAQVRAPSFSKGGGGGDEGGGSGGGAVGFVLMVVFVVH